MNMISTGAFLNEMDASNKQPTVAEKFAAVWEKKNAKAARAGGVSLMALSLAACGSSSTTTTTTDTSTDTSTDTTTTTPTAQSFTLTTSVDLVGDFTGGAADDTFVADNTGTTAAVSAADSIAGGAGTDALTVYLPASGTIAAINLDSIEVLNIHDLDGTQTLTNNNFDSLTTVNMVRGDGTAVLNLGAAVDTVSITDVALANAGTVINAEATLAAITVNLAEITNGGTGTEDITIDGTKLVTYTINATDDVTATLLDLDAATTITLNATGDVDTTIATTGTAALTMTGAGDIDLNSLDADINTITHTGSGDVTAVIGANSDTVLTTGSGADTITASTTDAIASTAKLAVDAGDGTDLLIIAEAVDVNTAADAARYSNFETARVGFDFDTDLISGITGIQVVATAGGITLSDVNATVADNIRLLGDVGTDTTITLKDATGSADSVSLDLRSATATSNVDAAGISVIGVETLNINSETGTAGTDTEIAFANVDTSDLTAINVTGTSDYSISTTNLDAVLTLDASTVTGDVTVSGVTVAGSAVKFGTGDDQVTVSSTLGTTYTMGSGDNTVIAAVATLVADGESDTVITAGSGTDILRLSDNGATVTDNHFTNVTGFDTLDLDDGSSSITTGAAFKAAFADGITITHDTLADTETFVFAGGLYDQAVTMSLDSDAVADGDAEDITITTGAGADTLTLVFSDWVGEDTNAGDIAVSTGAGNDTIALTTSTLADDNDGSLAIDAGTGADTITMTKANGSGASAYFTFTVQEGDSLTTAYDTITGYAKGDGTDLTDVIDFGDGQVSDGLTSTNFGSIASHSMTDGVATFDDASTYATALNITSANLAEVIGYLTANADTDDVVAFAFDSDASGTADGTMVFHKGDSVDDLVFLVGVTGIDDVIATAGTTANDICIG